MREDGCLRHWAGLCHRTTAPRRRRAGWPVRHVTKWCAQDHLTQPVPLIPVKVSFLSQVPQARLQLPIPLLQLVHGGDLLCVSFLLPLSKPCGRAGVALPLLVRLLRRLVNVDGHHHPAVPSNPEHYPALHHRLCRFGPQALVQGRSAPRG